LPAKGKKERDKPLAGLQEHLLALLPESSQRIEGAIVVLHHVIDIRDAGQHAPARGKGATALAALGVGYPPASWQDAWSIITVKTIEALDALRPFKRQPDIAISQAIASAMCSRLIRGGRAS